MTIIIQSSKTSRPPTYFKLGLKRMVETKSKSAGYNSRYQATRQAIRNAFRFGDGVRYFIGPNQMSYPTLTHISRTSLRIGCQLFTGINFRRLKTWALGGKS